jgi:hypothetical protein
VSGLSSRFPKLLHFYHLWQSYVLALGECTRPVSLQLNLHVSWAGDAIVSTDYSVSAVPWAACDDQHSSAPCNQCQRLYQSGVFLNSNFRFSVSLTPLIPVLTTRMILIGNENQQ